MIRTFDLQEFIAALEPYKKETANFDPVSWLLDHRNIALFDGVDNYNLFQYDTPGVYWAHTFFNTARGKDAIRLCRESLDWVFSVDSPVQVIKGLTPLSKPAARWINRKIGLQPHGVLKTVNGPCELFILDRHTYLERVN